jgi:hypothetical protein
VPPHPRRKAYVDAYGPRSPEGSTAFQAVSGLPQEGAEEPGSSAFPRVVCGAAA